MVTTPAGVIRRIVRLAVSPTYTYPRHRPRRPAGPEPGGAARAVGAADGARQAGHRGDDTGRRDLADRVAQLGDIDIARGIDGDGPRRGESRRTARAVDGAGDARQTREVVTTPAGVIWRIVWLNVSAT